MGPTAWSFIVLMILITVSGALSAIHKRKTTKDYLVASREISPGLTALSTVATNNSGFMFIGMIGYTYRLGLESVWMMIGWVLGDLMAWLLVHTRVRELSHREGCNSLPGLLGIGKGHVQRAPVIAGGVITIVFLGVYAAAQLKAGSTALHALFGWDMYIGALIGTAIVIIYSYAGGIRADIWTDAAQSLVMMVAMMMIMVSGWMRIGGFGDLLDNLRAQDPGLVGWFPEDLAFGFPPFVVGFAFAGLGVIGQPHLMTRIMAIKSSRSIGRAAVYYFAWYVPFFVASIAVGLYCRAIIPGLPELPVAQGLREPTELALPLLTMRLLPEVFVGVALAGLFAATVSTADSQIIVCSGALTQDIRPAWKDSYVASKLGTFAVTGISLAIALYAPEGVFGLVLVAWSALAASLGPVLLIRLLGWPLSSATSLVMMAVAVAVVSWWHVSPYDDDLFKALPGCLAAALVYGVSRLSARALQASQQQRAG